MRLLFAGSPAIAVPALEAIYRASRAGGHELVGVLTNPDAARGRSGKLEASEVGAALDALNAAFPDLPPVPVLKPVKLDAEARAQVEELGPDLLVTVAFGKIFGPKFLALFPSGGINLHPSRLPLYRGAAPIPAAILNRERETALSVQALALEMDSGDLLAQELLSLDGTETTASLSSRAGERGAALVLGVIDALASGTARPVPQDPSKATYCSMLKKEDGKLDWSLPAPDLDARVRAFTPWPLTFTMHRAQKLYILKAAPYTGAFTAPGEALPGEIVGIDKAAGILVQTGDGLLVLYSLQYESKKALDWKAFLNGARDFVGSRFGES